MPPFESDSLDGSLDESDDGLSVFSESDMVRVVAVDEPATTVTWVPPLPLAVMVRSGDLTVAYEVEYIQVEVRVSPASWKTLEVVRGIAEVVTESLSAAAFATQ